MFTSLMQTGKNIGHGINRAWENMADGWRELLSRSSDSLTHFNHNKDQGQKEKDSLSTFPRWSLLAGEVEETEKEIVVRMEVPGMEKSDCRIAVEGNMLQISGEKHLERETGDSTYHVMERAYGAFQRTIPLPRSVDTDTATATYRNGILTVRMLKEESETAKSITVL